MYLKVSILLLVVSISKDLAAAGTGLDDFVFYLPWSLTADSNLHERYRYIGVVDESKSACTVDIYRWVEGPSSTGYPIKKGIFGSSITSPFVRTVQAICYFTEGGSELPKSAIEIVARENSNKIIVIVDRVVDLYSRKKRTVVMYFERDV